MKSVVSNFPSATLIAEGKLVCVPAHSFGNYFDNLIEQDLDHSEFLKSRSYLFEDFTSQLSNLYIYTSSPSTDREEPSKGLRLGRASELIGG